MATYRNIFFNKGIVTKGTGKEIIRYTGKLYPNCTTMTDFFKLYDSKQDKVIACNKCAMKTFKEIIKARS